MTTSSSVRMTRTWTRLPSAEMTGSPAVLRISSNAMPRKFSPSQMRERTTEEFSPMPPVNTSVSTPPRAAANAPMHFLT